MKTYKWHIYYEGGDQDEVTAGSMTEALILSFAKRIPKALHRRVWQIVNVDEKEIHKGSFTLGLH